MIETLSPTCIDGGVLQEWLEESIKNLVPEGYEVYIIPNDDGAQGGSKFFTEVNINKKDLITLDELVKRVVKEHSRGQYLHYYVDDVIGAACKLDELTGSWFWVYCTW